MTTDKRFNCEALSLIVQAAQSHVWQSEAIFKLHGKEYKKDEELDTAMLMAKKYIEKHSQKEN